MIDTAKLPPCTCSAQQLNLVGCDCRQGHAFTEVLDIYDTVRGYAVPMAVVDYYADPDNLTSNHLGGPARYGARDLNGVKIYGLTVVAITNATVHKLIAAAIRNA